MKKSTSSRRGSKIPRSVISHPADFAPTLIMKRRLRFKATAASTGDVLTQASFGDLMCNTPTAITGFQLGNFVRIKSVEIWAPMAADLAPVTISLEWSGVTVGLFGKSVRHSDTSMGATEPAHLKSSPPLGSQVSQWFQSTGTAVICTLVYPANTVIDVVYSTVLRDDGSAVAVTGAIAGATPGATYVRPLNSPVNNNLVPVTLAFI